MLDLRLIREQPDFVKTEIAKLNTTAPIDEIVALDERRRAMLTEVETLKAQLNAGSRETGKKAAGEERDAHISAMRALGDEIARLDAAAAEVDRELHSILLTVPNLPSPDAPSARTSRTTSSPKHGENSAASNSCLSPIGR